LQLQQENALINARTWRRWIVKIGCQKLLQASNSGMGRHKVMASDELIAV
jgi:hypothetical protein